MTITVPFEYNEPVYILKKVQYLAKSVWVPPNYRLGGDVDGPFDRGHYNNIYEIKTEIKK